ncbi:MAG TPA: 16S rRNA (adenine(1518)-N(6)/adenine(1519)-N(6))-dimethyltransferase RsmA [Egibacteraceae bacterium]|nr:16S rRNA (adenine(1518)-N(6)/adenine(1519)-N(6))-dimethyltransferase RsmA [Egibacteraceae bacterium]
MLTVRDVRRLLAAHGLAPRKAYGQNFVIDANTVRKVVRDAGVVGGDLVLEVGPGLGSLTLALRAAGARVVALEVDTGLVRALHEVVGSDPAVRIVHGDALTVDLGELVGGGPAALVANLPYNTATPIMMRALQAGAFDRMLVMVQKEVGERWAAEVGHPQYGAVSVKMAALAAVEVVAPVSRAAFYPAPNVDSVTVRLATRRWDKPVDRRGLFRLVEEGFSQRRKRLRNALAAMARPGAVEQALLTAGLSAGARAEELDLDAWVRLALALER